jgi:DNA invertase Pin-like site-specific DNA recombinase
MVKRALIYARESKYEARQGNRSPEEQVEIGRQWCEDEGHEVAAVIVEAGIGASRHSRGVRRGWQQAKQLIESHDVDILVTWASSRATRKLGEYLELRDLCAEHGVLWCIKGRVYDLNSRADRLGTGVLALMDEDQAEAIKDDVRRALRANARNGLPHGRQVYGYRRTYDSSTRALTGQEPHPDEARVVRRIFHEYLAGRSVRGITEGLNADGVPTHTGSPWHRSTVRGILSRPAYIAQRVHRGELLPAGWAPIIDRDQWERVQRRLEVHRETNRRQATGVNLLTGVARCSVCGGPMHGSTSTGPRGTGKSLYVCEKRCSGRDRARLDAWVEAIVVERLSRPDVAEALEGAPDPAAGEARTRVEELRAELAEAMKLWKAKKLSVQAYAEMEAELGRQITEAEREARRALVPLDLDVPDEGVAEWWKGLERQQQREIVGALIAAVVVQPVGKGRRRFDPADHTEIEWRR